MNADQFRDIFHVLHNIDKSDLEAAGVIAIGANGGSDWNRFNNDVGTFVLKLRQENLEALFDLVRSRMPVAFGETGMVPVTGKERPMLQPEAASTKARFESASLHQTPTA